MPCQCCTHDLGAGQSTECLSAAAPEWEIKTLFALPQYFSCLGLELQFGVEDGDSPIPSSRFLLWFQISNLCFKFDAACRVQRVKTAFMAGLAFDSGFYE
jgi:hypothetical protein